VKAPKSLRTVISDLVAHAQSHLPSHVIHSLLETPTPSQQAGELHISITHPLPLRRSQVDPLRIELIAALQTWARTRRVENMRCSLAGIPSVYYNGKATGGEGKGGRAFLALRVGAGAVEVSFPLFIPTWASLICSLIRSLRKSFIQYWIDITYRYTTLIRNITPHSLGVYLTRGL
jgi:hypothetical protein